MADTQHGWANARGFLPALARDARGNTLAIMAMALIPLAGMVGGGVDISRMYIVKTRLQHACDAGALAGRKSMGGGTWAYNNNAARTSAENFFDANYSETAYGVTSRTRSFSESAGKVSGTATAVLPMTLMRIFGRTTETLTVTCDAEMRLPNTDVMFVLDTTGSMDSKAISTDPDKKIDALKTAVKCFYEIVARYDTDANCTGGAPSGGTGDQVQIRFGFVPYSVNVNVGRLLPTGYFPNSWNYQTRKPRWTNVGGVTTTYGPTVDTTGNGGSATSDWTDWSNVSSGLLSCPANPGDQNNVSGSYSIDTDPVVNNGVRTWETRTYTRVNIDYETGRWSGLRCYLQSRQQGTGSFTTVVHTQTVTQTQNRTFAGWDYDALPIDISGLKSGSNWNASLTIPEIADGGTDRTVTWDGCIEERQTVSGTNFATIPSGAYDLDIDTPPTSDVRTMWKPTLGDIEYMRKSSGGNYTTSGVTVTTADRGAADRNLNFTQPAVYCPTESRKMQKWNSATVFDDYVDSLVPVGNTYHDIGLLWGARLLSPTGIFKTENAYTPQGGEIERHLIFMTDGDTQTSTSNYAAYGTPWYDRRNVTASDVGSSPGGSMNDQVNARFEALCTAVKNKNITLWVISFGSGSNATTEDRLEKCATSGRYFVARDSATLQNTFRSIADQISQLRLTK